MAKAAAAAPPGGKKAKKKDKKKLIRNVGIGFSAFAAFIIWFGLQPLQGPPSVGVCRTYAEMQIYYPHTMRLTSTDQYQNLTRLFYTFFGPFGEFRSNVIECAVGTDQATGQMTFTAITINGNPVPKESLEAFNKTIPFILQHNPNNSIPFPFSGDLYDLKRTPHY